MPENSQPKRISRHSLHRAWGSVQTILAGLGVFLLLVTFTRLDIWWSSLLAGPWNDPKGEVLIVLGGSVLEDGTIGVSSYWRAVYAARAWKEGGFKAIVLSGGGGTASSAAESMRDFLVEQGIPREAIRLDIKSQSTRENALFSKTILNQMPGRKVLLTSDFHMYRAYRAFRKVGVDVLPRPFPDVGKRAHGPLGRWEAFFDLVEETAKIIDYYLRGWI
ncbi:MAG: YdcF family protein [Candidatus Acidiferrales bacterium]